jgi:hypothetical protein
MYPLWEMRVYSNSIRATGTVCKLDKRGLKVYLNILTEAAPTIGQVLRIILDYGA